MGFYFEDRWDEHVELTSNIPNLGASWTVLALVKFDDLLIGPGVTVYERGKPGGVQEDNANYHLGTWNSKLRAHYEYGSGTDVFRFGATTLSTGTLYWVCSRRDDAHDSLDVFLNGSNDNGSSSGSLSSPPDGSDATGIEERIAMAARLVDGSDVLEGDVHVVYVFNKALCDDEIAELSRAPHILRQAAYHPNLRRYFRLDHGAGDETFTYDISGGIRIAGKSEAAGSGETVLISSDRVLYPVRECWDEVHERAA